MEFNSEATVTGSGVGEGTGLRAGQSGAGVKGQEVWERGCT